MKKFMAIVLTLLFMFSFSGCNNNSNKEQENAVVVNDSLILVQSMDTLSKPYENFIWSESWSGNGWLSGDGVNVSFIFPQVHNEIPEIIYADDFEIHYQEGVTLSSLSVYNSDFEEIDNISKQENLADLAEGEYYLVISVKSQGEYIEAEERFEYAGYECVYKMVIAE